MEMMIALLPPLVALSQPLQLLPLLLATQFLGQETRAAALISANAAPSSDAVDVMREEIEKMAQEHMTVRSPSDTLDLGLTWLDFNVWSTQVFRLCLTSDSKAPAAMDLLMHHVQNKQHPHQQEGLKKANGLLSLPAIKKTSEANV